MPRCSLHKLVWRRYILFPKDILRNTILLHSSLKYNSLFLSFNYEVRSTHQQGISLHTFCEGGEEKNFQFFSSPPSQNVCNFTILARGYTDRRGHSLRYEQTV